MYASLIRMIPPKKLIINVIYTRFVNIDSFAFEVCLVESYRKR